MREDAMDKAELDLAIKGWQAAFDEARVEVRKLQETLGRAERKETHAYIKLQDALCARENLESRSGSGWRR
tara:strand:+ start:1438 stop:1650 length:213 start_codon:yes stop_codon:yes gene_type:complete